MAKIKNPLIKEWICQQALSIYLITIVAEHFLRCCCRSGISLCWVSHLEYSYRFCLSSWKKKIKIFAKLPLYCSTCQFQLSVTFSISTISTGLHNTWRRITIQLEKVDLTADIQSKFMFMSMRMTVTFETIFSYTLWFNNIYSNTLLRKLFLIVIHFN